jgi:hypothetical protein
MADRSRTALLRTAAVCAAVSGLGFGLPAAYAPWYFAEHGRVWIFAGFPTYGEGPFEDVGIPTSVPLLVAFALVCATELVAAALLWLGSRAGTVLALVLLPVEFAFWIGFALPFGPPLAVVRTVAVGMAAGRQRRYG